MGGTGVGSGHQLAVVAYRDGQLYCICTEAEVEHEEGAEWSGTYTVCGEKSLRVMSKLLNT